MAGAAGRDPSVSTSLGMTGRVMALAACAAIAGASLIGLFVEARPYFVSGVLPAAKIAAIVDGQLSVGASFASQRIVLDDCFVATRSLAGRASPTPRRRVLLERCDQLAADIVASTPSNAYAWLVAAAVALEREDFTAFDGALSRSQQLSANEGWLALQRATLAAEAGDDLGPRANLANAADLGVLVAQVNPPRVLLGRYRIDPAFREQVNHVVGASPPAVQRSFIAAVREDLLRGGR